MSVAKALKLKEYHTDIISHELSYSNTPNLGTAPRVRFTNTYKSNVLASTPTMDVTEQALTGKITAEQVHLKSRDRLFNEKPLTAKIQRASYQDSNIFGYKEREDITVQTTAKADDKATRLRNNQTFQSKAFDHLDGSYKTLDEADRHPSTTRQELKWKSQVFEDPIVEQSRRKRLNKKDASVDALFGHDIPEYASMSQIASFAVKKALEKQFLPVRQQQPPKTAIQRKNDEIYGKSATSLGTGAKLDGSLMANCADWRNPHQTYTNSPSKTTNKNVGSENFNAKDRKFGNLESQVPLGGELSKNSDIPNYNATSAKAAFGTSADWSHQAASAKLNNIYGKVDTYKKRQEQLSSNVFDQSQQYNSHAPLRKSTVDVNNMNE